MKNEVKKASAIPSVEVIDQGFISAKTVPVIHETLNTAALS